MMTTSSFFRNKGLWALLALVTFGFAAILLPFFGAIFWAVVFAILFNPLNRRLAAAFKGKATLAAIATLLICLFVVILPLIFIGISVITEGMAFYEMTKSGSFDFGRKFSEIIAASPTWVVDLLGKYGLSNLDGIQEKLSSVAADIGKVVGAQAVKITQNTLSFLVNFGIMIYMMFFMLRDGPVLIQYLVSGIPMDIKYKDELIEKFATVVKAPVKGNVVVAAVQGALGGLIFWFLDIQGAFFWGTAMAFLSLLPAVGAGLVWGPVAIYFFATGQQANGVILVAYAVCIIGLVDNLLRPILVGKDTKMPDYMVLISTLGGMSIFGLTGFVIGPLIAALFIAVWAICIEHIKDGEGSPA